MNISDKQNQSQKRCEARDVSNAQTDVSLHHSHVHDPDHTACVTKFTLLIPHDPKIVCVNGGDFHKSKGFLFEQSLMVRYVYIHPVHNIEKKLVILLRGRTG